MAFDYDEAKRFFVNKLATDIEGKGRMESALYHTANMIYEAGAMDIDKTVQRQISACSEMLLQRDARISALESALRYALGEADGWYRESCDLPIEATYDTDEMNAARALIRDAKDKRIAELEAELNTTIELAAKSADAARADLTLALNRALDRCTRPPRNA